MTTDEKPWVTFHSPPPESRQPLPPPVPLPPPMMMPTPPKDKRRILGVPLWAWGLIVAAVALITFGAITDNDNESASNDDQAYMAHAGCAEFTRDRLKAPSTADFPEYDDAGVSVTHNGDTWTVRSHVDAENGFGANIRTSFECVVRDVGDQWRLIRWTEL